MRREDEVLSYLLASFGHLMPMCPLRGLPLRSCAAPSLSPEKLVEALGEQPVSSCKPP